MARRMEDPITGYVPSRVTVLEEEERDAQASSSSFEDLPLITWGAGTAKSVAEGGDKQKLQVMVLATSLECCALLRHCGGLGEEQGLICLPADCAANSTPAQRSGSAACSLHSPKEGGASVKGHGRVIYALCPANIPAERAFAWAKGVLGQLQPEQVIVQTSLSAAEFRGHDSEEDAAARQFAVSTSAAAGNTMDQVLPKLPTGNLVSGVAAAVMSRLQARGVPATLLVSVQASGMPGLDTLKSLAGALQACLAAAGCAPDGLKMFMDKSALAAASQDLRKAWKKNPRSLLYI